MNDFCLGYRFAAANNATISGILSNQRSSLATSNRLDRNTEGLIAIAKNAASQRELNAAFKDGRIERYYTAKVVGEVKGDVTIDYPLYKSAKTNTVFADKDGSVPPDVTKEAITKVHPIRVNRIDKNGNKFTCRYRYRGLWRVF